MPNKIELLVLLQLQDNDGVLFLHEKVAMQMGLDKTGTRMKGTGAWQLFEAGIGPLGPNTPVYAEGPFTQTARLIR